MQESVLQSRTLTASSALQEYVKPENIVMDRQSGKNLDRPGYNALKGIFGLRPGDDFIHSEPGPSQQE